ncbi:uncharacterized protein BXZ73DRAFT_109095 [Epithele typhae]|uniref:uncharacterized protein n=1 Tax=Epithele typhae TaxID=378194 RepID=UPI0020078ACA|nr:uncharacterized protein BXZ73DRAFT_109095 [Epithele typhae]KAH9910392.1 hypothetical protein BXZ73DRAFT_109095 [Epithele typhae]
MPVPVRRAPDVPGVPLVAHRLGVHGLRRRGVDPPAVNLFWLPVPELQQFPPPFQAPLIEDLTRLSLSLPVIPMPAVPPSTFRRPSRGSGVLSALLVVDPDQHSMMTMMTTTTTILVIPNPGVAKTKATVVHVEAVSLIAAVSSLSKQSPRDVAGA